MLIIIIMIILAVIIVVQILAHNTPASVSETIGYIHVLQQLQIVMIGLSPEQYDLTTNEGLV